MLRLILLLTIFFIRCNKESQTAHQPAKEDSVLMSLVVDENLAAIPNGCGAGAYRNIIYNPEVHLYFSFSYGFDGTNCTYGNLDSYGGTSSFWVNGSNSWQLNYLGGSITGWVMTNSPQPRTLGYGFNWHITPNTCMIHWNWQPK